MFDIPDISKVFYYPAAGTDIQPMLRFSHLTDTILAPTLSSSLTRERMSWLFSAKCEALNSYYGKTLLELVSVDDFDHHLDAESLYVSGAEEIFTLEEQAAYMEAFQPLVPNKLSATRFVFKRRIGRIERRINWIHTTTEGLATLLLLYQCTGKIPDIICTIQSGVLEYPVGLMKRLFDRIMRYPRLWIRGYWPLEDPAGVPLMRAYPYGTVAQNYGYWNSSFGISTDPNEDNPSKKEPYQVSWVRAFSWERFPLLASSLTMTGKCNQERRITVVFGSIYKHGAKFDGSIVSARMRDSGLQPRTPKATTWEALGNRGADSRFPPLTGLEALKAAGDYARREGIGRLALAPIGYEDEWGSIREYLDGSGASLDITFFVIRPLDFIALVTMADSGGW